MIEGNLILATLIDVIIQFYIKVWVLHVVYIEFNHFLGKKKIVEINIFI